MSKTNDFARKTVWRCHDCEKIAGTTYEYGISPAFSNEIPGTDWQRFFTFQEYAQHRITVHGNLVGSKIPASKIAFYTVPYCLCNPTGEPETCHCFEQYDPIMKIYYEIPYEQRTCPCFTKAHMRPVLKNSLEIPDWAE